MQDFDGGFQQAGPGFKPRDVGPFPDDLAVIGEGEGLVRLAKNADLFLAHNAVPEGAVGIERRLHMPPSVIGQIAEDAKVKRLVLSHRMLRTLGKEDQTQSEIKRRYLGPVVFANDLDCFPVR